MGKIIIRELLTYAYHGCLSEEKKIGGQYKTTLWIHGDFSKAEKSDLLEKTIDYERAIELINDEMQKPSNLIENVANRVLNRIMSEFPNIDKLEIKLIKINPPVKAEAPQVEYFLEKKR